MSDPADTTDTAARIVALLRHGSMTVDELAAALALTPNAVRPHLVRLERDGVVVRAGMRRLVSRPAVVYAISEEAEARLSRAYEPVLTRLLDVLERQLEPAALDRILRQVGVELAAGRAAPRGSLRRRAEAASDLLGELGGASRVESDRGALRIRGYGCPLATATRAHPEACRTVASLLGAFIGAPVSECCERGARMRCCFSVGRPPRARRPRAGPPSR